VQYHAGPLGRLDDGGDCRCEQVIDRIDQIDRGQVLVDLFS